jgi:hypothetical protein
VTPHRGISTLSYLAQGLGLDSLWSGPSISGGCHLLIVKTQLAFHSFLSPKSTRIARYGAHCNPSAWTGRWRQEDLEVEASLGYMQDLVLKKNSRGIFKKRVWTISALNTKCPAPAS